MEIVEEKTGAGSRVVREARPSYGYFGRLAKVSVRMPLPAVDVPLLRPISHFPKEVKESSGKPAVSFVSWRRCTNHRQKRNLSDKILTIRGQKVILDRDLAAIYGVPTKALNQAVRCNRARFPEEFAFLLTAEEVTVNRSQFVTGSGKHRDRRYVPVPS